MFITNNHASFRLWWKENLVKLQKVSKYYENDCSIETTDEWSDGSGDKWNVTFYHWQILKKGNIILNQKLMSFLTMQYKYSKKI